MISFFVGLTLASCATAQVVSMVPNPNMSASGSASSSSPMSAPPAPTASSSGSDSSGYSSSPSYNQYNSSPPPSYNQYTAPPAQYTPPPQSEAMPYESFKSGGYKSMGCGYGYSKGYDGSCTSTESWVRISHLEISSAMQFMRSNHTVVYNGLL
jgi:hypothetical protein